MATKEWLRPEHEGDELESVEEFCERHGVRLMAFRGHISRYHDWFPKPVRMDNGRTKFFLPGELDQFFGRIKNSDQPRSRIEVANAEVSRLTEWVGDQQRREQVRRDDWEKSTKDLKAARAKLRAAKEQRDLLSQ